MKISSREISLRSINLFYSSEIELLLCSSRTYISPPKKERIKNLIQHNIDWDYFFELAKKHGTIPLFYKTLNFIGPETVSDEIFQKARDYSYSVALRNTLFLKELLNIMSLFEENGIRLITFKGPVLAAKIYGDLSLRVFSDLDILVQRRDFLSACTLLNSNGYDPVWQWSLLNKECEQFLLGTKDEYSFKKDFIAVDLHQVLTAEHFLASQFIFENLWERIESVSISGHDFISFGNEDLFLYLCIHGSKECWRNLKWICDIAEFISRYPNIDWEKLILRANRMGCERIVLLSFLMAYEVLEIDLPSIVHTKVKDDLECKALAQELSERLFLKDNSLSNRLTLEKAFIHIRMLDLFKDKWACLWDLRRIFIEFLIKILPNQRDRDFLSLPIRLYFLYYLVRPLRFLIIIFSKLCK